MKVIEDEVIALPQREMTTLSAVLTQLRRGALHWECLPGSLADDTACLRVSMRGWLSK